MVRSLYSAASGMMAQQTNVDVIANNLANAFAEFGKASEEAAKCCSSAIRTVTASAVVSELERLVCKYEKASFITRWYWKRRIKKLNLAFDELETILNEQ